MSYDGSRALRTDLPVPGMSCAAGLLACGIARVESSSLAGDSGNGRRIVCSQYVRLPPFPNVSESRWSTAIVSARLRLNPALVG